MPWWFPFGSVPETPPADLSRALRGKAAPQVLDVRTAAEFKAGHIAGALHCDVRELSSRLAGLGLDPARPVVAVCLSAHRSPPAVRLLQSRGFVDARQLAGGMMAWQSAGLPTRR
jgi:rhodanese-related sulfurtransferase